MAKTVHKHVPADELPEKFRRGIANDRLITLTVEEEGGQTHPQTFDRDALRRLLDSRRATGNGAKPVSLDDAVRRVRGLRDEWDEG